MDKLVAGLRKYRSEIVGQEQEMYHRLSQGQAPEVLFFTCSDSRLDPNLITQTKPGEMFVVRNAGNIVPPHGASTGGEEATIEFGVSVLGVKRIIVCGHSSCGAMSGLLDRDAVRALPAVFQWLSHAEATLQVVLEKHKGVSGPELLRAATEENVLVQMTNLRTHPVVAARLATGRLTIEGWVVDIRTGEVSAYSESDRCFVCLNPVGVAVAA
jgi:carbonic anhydrase